MKIIFIYGAPAVGKLSVAQELAQLTKFRLFHNHMSLDLAESMYEWGSSEFWNFVTKNRLETLEKSAKSEEEGIIMTYVYEGCTNDDDYINKLKQVASKYNSKIYFVKLSCHIDELKKRVVAESRTKFKKIKSVEKLLLSLSKKNPNEKLAADLSIDNTQMDPVSVAIKIKSEFAL